MDEKKLESCPFCGSECFNYDYGEEGWYVECNGCYARGPSKPTIEEAEAAWNRRW